MSDKFIDVVEDIGNSQLQAVQAKLGNLWDRFNSQDKDIALKVAKDSAKLQLESMRNPAKDLSAEWKHIDAQISLMTANNLTHFRMAFWETLGGVLQSGIGGIINAGFKSILKIG